MAGTVLVDEVEKSILSQISTTLVKEVYDTEFRKN